MFSFFNKERYRAKNHWGSYLWGFIHTITIIDHDEKTYNYNISVIEKLKAIHKIIPCSKCEPMYSLYIKKLDYLNLNEAMILFKWSVDLHNAVNKKLGQREWSYKKALEFWTKKI
jgi:hypothetical protein